MNYSSQEMESIIFTIIICEQKKIHMQFFHHTTNSGSPVISEPVLLVIIYSDPRASKHAYRRHYKASLENNMPDFLADVPLIIRRETHFMHNGAPAGT
jgi:hypothetical protein